MSRRSRIGLLILAMAGLIGATGIMKTTSASWNDSTNFAAQVSSGNWGTPPTPTNEGGISPGNPHTVINDIVWTINGSRQFCTEVVISGATATANHWAINIDLTQPPFYGVNSNQVNTNGTGVVTTTSATTVRITGNSANNRNSPWNPQWNNTPITSAQVARLTICIYNAPVPAPPPTSTGWYTVSTGRGTWTDTKACVVTTVTSTKTDLANYPYYFGWTTQLDLSAAKARILSAGNVLNFVSWSPYPNGATDMYATPANYNPPLDTYTITSGYNLALRAMGGGANSRTFTACVEGYSTRGNGRGNGNNGASNMAVPTGESVETTAEVTTGKSGNGTTSTVPSTPATVPTSSVPASSVPASSAPTPPTSVPTEAPTASTSTAPPETTALPEPTNANASESGSGDEDLFATDHAPDHAR